MKRFFILSCLLLQSNIAWAGTIKLDLEANATLSQEKLEGNVSFKNAGDQNAYNPAATIEYNSINEALPGKPFLSPGASYQINFSLENKDFQIPGSYLIATKFSYLDEAGYKFTLPFLIKVINTEESHSGIRVTAKEIDYSDNPEEKITITNLEDSPKEINLTFYNAMGIEFLPKTDRIKLAEKETQVITFNAEAKDLWPNLYTSYVVAEYQLENKHFTTSAQINLLVKEKDKSSLRKTQILTNTGIIILLLGLGAAIIYKKAS